jgi:ribose transport system substrate-binding protein
MQPRSRLFLALSIPVLVLTGSCGPAPQVSSQGTYYLVATNVKIPYWQSAASGLKRAASELHVKAELIGPDTYQPRLQHEAFQHALSLDPAGILISVGDRRLMRADIDSAIERGIPVFTIDSDAESSKRLLFVGTDNYKAGVTMGTIVAGTLNGKGNIVVFTLPDQLNLVERLRGLNETVAGHAGLKVTQVVDMKGDPQVVRDTAKEILTKNAAKVDALLCLEAIACPEIAEVLSTMNVSGKLVVSMDADPRTLDWIKKGFISATIAQKPFTMAYVGLRMMADLNQIKLGNLDRNWIGSPVSPMAALVDTGVTLVNHDNVDEYIKESSSTQ